MLVQPPLRLALRRAGLALAVALASLPGPAQAAPGELAWRQQLDLGGAADQPRALAPSGDWFIVAGDGSAAGVPTWIVRAYDAKHGGALLWSDARPNPPGPTEARAIAAAAGRAVVAGFAHSAVGDEWLVRVHDAKTGTLLWDDQLNVNGGDARANAVAVRGRRTIVAGEVTAAGQTNWLVRAYDTKTGATLWADQPAGTTDDGRGAEVAVVSGARVIVGGAAEDANGNSDWRLRAYDVHTGTLLWEKELDLEGEDDVLVDLSMKGSRLLAGGNVTSSDGNQDLLVRVYATMDGTLLWTDRVDGAEGGDDELTAVHLHGSFAFAAGQVDDDAWTQANLSKTGVRIWDDAWDGGAVDRANDVAFKGNEVHVVGRTAAGGSDDVLVRALDFVTGQLRWQSVDDVDGSDELGDLIVWGPFVYAIGAADAGGDRDWLVEVRERF